MTKPSLCNLFGKDPCSESEVRFFIGFHTHYMHTHVMLEPQVKEISDALVDTGMVDLGYEYVVLDDCWSAKTSDNATGNLQADASKFPNGMKDLADYVHKKGLKFGLYTSVGDVTCKGDRPGSLDNYERDAKTLASWGVDFIKMDHCGDKHNATDLELYGTMSQALNKTERPILFSLCNWGEQDVWDWGSNISQMYRVQQDHLPFWSYTLGQAQGVGYGQGTKEIIEWMAHLDPSKYTREYGFMDPDFLMTMFDPLTYVLCLPLLLFSHKTYIKTQNEFRGESYGVYILGPLEFASFSLYRHSTHVKREKINFDEQRGHCCESRRIFYW